MGRLDSKELVSSVLVDSLSLYLLPNLISSPEKVFIRYAKLQQSGVHGHRTLLPRTPPAIVSCILSTPVSRHSYLWLLAYIEKTEPIRIMVPQAAFAPYDDAVNTGNISVDYVHENRRTVRSLAKRN